MITGHYGHINGDFTGLEFHVLIIYMYIGVCDMIDNAKQKKNFF
jgi:hypothetical protein